MTYVGEFFKHSNEQDRHFLGAFLMYVFGKVPVPSPIWPDTPTSTDSLALVHKNRAGFYRCPKLSFVSETVVATPYVTEAETLRV